MIVITAATGNLGTHVVEQLLERVPASKIRLAVRSPEKAARFAARGVEVVPGDYDQPDQLEKAFQGAEKVLLISSSAVGQRARQHKAAIDAAVAAGVPHLVYTSILGAPTTHAILAEEHVATEKLLAASGIPYTVLRNGWYTENYTESLGSALAAGGFIGAAGDGKISAASRADYAAAAVAVLTGEGHVGKAYELGGDEPFTMAGLAAEVSRQTGRELPYTNLPAADYEKALADGGVPGPFAAVLADIDVTNARGEGFEGSNTLSRLIGRPTTPLADVVASALA